MEKPENFCSIKIEMKENMTEPYAIKYAMEVLSNFNFWTKIEWSKDPNEEKVAGSYLLATYLAKETKNKNKESSKIAIIKEKL